MKYKVSILLFLTMLFSCKQNSKVKKTYKKDYTAINDTLTKNLQSVFKKGTIVRFSVSIVDDQGFIYENGFGYTDIALTKKYTSNTTQNIASISKTLIVVSLLKAKEQGKLNLNEPINKYLPFNVINPNYPEKPILIKHLAYHTSSIVDIDEVYSKSYVLKKAEHNENKGLYDWFNMPKTKILLIDFIKNNLTVKGKWYTKEIFAITTPREIREYSNIGAAICAQIIEFATRQDYQSFTKDYIIKPLKRASSGWSSKDINTTKRSRLFATKKMLIAEYSLITSADGGFITSNKNLGLFLAEFMKDFKGEGKLLSKESYKKLFKKQQFSNIETEEKFGIFIEFSNEFIKIKNNVIGHNRSDPGVMKAMYFNQKTETGKILFVNTDSDFDANFWPKVALI